MKKFLISSLIFILVIVLFIPYSFAGEIPEDWKIPASPGYPDGYKYYLMVQGTPSNDYIAIYYFKDNTFAYIYRN